MLDEFPGSDLFVFALYSKGCVFISLNDFDSAREVFAQLLKKFPNDKLAPEAKFKFAEALYEAKKFEEARRIFEAS